MPRASVRGQSPSQGGWSEDFWSLGLSLSQCGHVFANSVRYVYMPLPWCVVLFQITQLGVGLKVKLFNIFTEKPVCQRKW